MRCIVAVAGGGSAVLEGPGKTLARHLAEIHQCNRNRYAAMSRASDSLTPRLGIAVAGSMRCGSTIHATNSFGVLATSPAMMVRRPNQISGGPTIPSAFRTPGIT